MNQLASHSIADTLWDFVCCASIVGIWPRFIEPKLLSVNKLRLPIRQLPASLQGLTLLQFSDLHLQPNVSTYFLDKLLRKIESLKPDMILFTGDFLCYGRLTAKESLQYLLNGCSAPYGCYAILGNHDYAEAVSFNEAGDYDILEKAPSAILKGLKRLFVNLVPTGRVTERAKKVETHQELQQLLERSPFKLLHNQTVCVPIKGSALNVCGLGEYMLGRCQPSIAFQDYQESYPGLILAHNPDSLPLLKAFPGDLVLCGHTHGGQINLPWIWKRYTIMEELTYARGGLFSLPSGKKLYVSRGIGSVLPFRWCARPELVHFTLEAAR